MSRVTQRARAVEQLREQAIHLAEQASPETAVRFLEAVRAGFDQLSERPELGRLREFRNPSLVRVRSWRVPRFNQYLIFYQPIEDGIEVLAVLHGARDLEAIFEEDFAEDES